MVLPNRQPPIALKPCFVPAPSCEQQPHRQASLCPLRRDRAGDDSLALAVSLSRRTQLLDHPDRLVTDGQSLCDRVFAFQDVHIGAANRGCGDPEKRVQGPGAGTAFSSRTIRPGSTNTAAFIILDMIDIR